jgi:nicotinamidase-related amidase
MSTVLLLVDVQNNMLRPPNPVPDADVVGPVIDALLARARAAGVPVVHVRNNGGAGDPDEPGTVGWTLAYPPADGEPVVDKWQPDAFTGTGIADLVPPSASLVVAGMQSDYCVRATVLAGLRRGHQVTLVRGGHATYPDGRAATVIADDIEHELAQAGAAVLAPVDVEFTRT